MDPKRLQAIEDRKPANVQARSMTEIQDVLEELVLALAEWQDESEKTADSYKDLLDGIKAALEGLSGKEAPALPDYATPVVEALKGLETKMGEAISQLEINPQINVAPPDVKVTTTAPSLTGVTSEVAKIPAAFAEAIANIPPVEPTDFSPLTDFFQEMTEYLDSISIGVHQYPAMPDKMEVSGPNNDIVGGSYGIARIDDTTDPTYFGFEDNLSNWYILQEWDLNQTWLYTRGAGGLASQWANRTSLTYADKGTVF